MKQTSIKLVTVGHMPLGFDKQKIVKWKSSVFEIDGEIESFALTEDSDGEDWEFTDSSLERHFPIRLGVNFLMILVNVPLEDNWYTRRLSNNRVVFTFHEIKEFLTDSGIPLENVVYKALYEYALVFRRFSRRIPVNGEHTNFTHDETRGCLFDMNGVKSDIIYSCHVPMLCSSCIEQLKNQNVSEETVSAVKQEIRKIKKPLFYRVLDFVKKHPVWAAIISTIWAVLLSGIGSFGATLI